MIVRGLARQAEYPVTRGLRPPVAAWQLLTVLAAWGSPSEQLSIATSTKLSPISRLGSTDDLSLSPLEYRALASDSWPLPGEWKGDLVGVVTAAGERLSGVSRDATVSDEWLTSVLSSNLYPVTVSGSITRAASEMIEWSAAATGSRMFASEHLTSLTVVSNYPVSRRALTESSDLLPVEFIKDVVSVDRSSLSPIELLSGAQSSVMLPEEQSGRTQRSWLFPVQLSYRTTMWVIPGPGCWTVLAREVTMSVLSPDITMSLESP